MKNTLGAHMQYKEQVPGQLEKDLAKLIKEVSEHTDNVLKHAQSILAKAENQLSAKKDLGSNRPYNS